MSVFLSIFTFDLLIADKKIFSDKFRQVPYGVIDAKVPCLGLGYSTAVF